MAVLDRFVNIVHRGDVGVVIVLKSASRSMLSVHRKKIIHVDTMGGTSSAPLPAELHVFVRDPIERLRSAYQFFGLRLAVIATVNPDDEPTRGEFTWENFIDNVLAGSKNPHWRPVSETVGKLKKSGVIPHLFENVADEYPLGELPTKNASRPIEGLDLSYRSRDLRELYAGDYAMRARAGR
jgi:hypothetical protein